MLLLYKANRLYLTKVLRIMLSCVLAWPDIQMTRSYPSRPHCEPKAVDVILFTDDLLHRDHQPV